MRHYLYQSHLGGSYISEESYTSDDLYCETCNDADDRIGFFDDMEDLEQLVADYNDYYGYERLDLNGAVEEFEDILSETQHNQELEKGGSI